MILLMTAEGDTDPELVLALETVNYHEVEPEMIGERERETIWCVNKSYLDLRIITLLLLPLHHLFVWKENEEKRRFVRRRWESLSLPSSAVKNKVLNCFVVLDDRTTTVAISDESPCYQSHDYL